MEPEIVEKLKARIVAAEVSILPPSIQRGAQYLLNARNDRDTWGAYPGMSIDLVSSAVAIEALESCEHSEFEPMIRTSRFALRDHISRSLAVLNLAGLTASLRILARADRNADLSELVESIVSRIRELRNGSGWGSPVLAIPSTSDVLLALLPYRDLCEDMVGSAIKLLHDEQNQDGGWPVAAEGSDSAPVPSARAIYTLVSAQPDQAGNDFQDASRYLQGLLGSGWKPLLSESGGVQMAALVLRAAAVLKFFPFDTVSQGIELILDQRNPSDDAWGERRGGNSNVEVTSCCLVALCAAGSNRLINSKFALSAINDAGLALQETRRELDQIRGDIRNQVTRGTGRIVAENDRLNAKVIELEKEKKILVSKVEEGERTILSFVDDVSTRVDVTTGRRSLRRSLGTSDFLLLSLRNLYPITLLLVGGGAIVLSIAAIRPWLVKMGLSPEVLKFLYYGAYVFIGFCGILVFLRVLLVLWPEWSSRRVSGLELRAGSIGASDRKLVQRRLATYMSEWPAGTREIFLHMLSRLPELPAEVRESAARSLARDVAARGGQQYEELSVLLSLFSGLPEYEQREVLYSLREVQRRVATL